MNNIETIVGRLQQQYPNTRVLPFMFNGQKHWLKQVEKTQGAMRLLKGNAYKSLYREQQKLVHLNHIGAPVPKLVNYGSDYLVIEDVGDTLNKLVDDKNVTDECKLAYLVKASQTLAYLHQLNETHGRPALRDIAYRNNKIYFIDFESHFFTSQLTKRKIRDLLLFLHGLFRSQQVNEIQIKQILDAYRACDGEIIWQQAVQWIKRHQWVYRIAKWFEKIAGKDLMASLKLARFILHS